MKSSLTSLVALTATVITSGAFAASNMENPLYMPKSNEAYVKLGAAAMYKKVDATDATKIKGTDGNVEFPVWRFTGDLGYGITDRLDIHGRFGYTHDHHINRSGMHRGRLGLTFRALTEKSPVVWDLYADAYLSGVTPMKGTLLQYGPNMGFEFANYSNGRYGVIAGTRFGKTFSNDLTLAAHVEYLQTFGNNRNKINIGIPDYATILGADQISVKLKSTHEWTAGFDAMYQINPKWSIGGGFEYVQHADNGVEGIDTKINDSVQARTVAAGLLEKTKDMKDGWDEYVIKVNGAYQMTDALQLAVFAEYTFDSSHANSQNGTDIKAEAGVRLNARF